MSSRTLQVTTDTLYKKLHIQARRSLTKAVTNQSQINETLAETDSLPVSLFPYGYQETVQMYLMCVTVSRVSSP